MTHDHRFCNLCGTFLQPKGDDLSCLACGYKRTSNGERICEVVLSHKWDPPAKTMTVQYNEKVEYAITTEVCPKCEYPKMMFWTKQLRSVDEGQTVFYKCVQCGYCYSTNT